ncbi:arylesterase [Antarcticirhabdus aurantiaca]|uniref:Arylesterase n=1 Tax=Antarcticirhabdus aurantiaca TaxID=2606717 RepID=A0ACD4NQN4_9HYPH|nr:arylesterase [Antarcticirhabdus aurantiaca]WAJ29073.1 arylesterase [Jeongeuplla avenae]
MQRFQSLFPVLTLLSWLALALGAPSASAQGTRPIEVVAFGDSLSAGLGVGPGESFPEQLQAALRSRGYEASVVNAGVSGDTTTGGLARLDWSVPESADLVILELGANDALRGVSPDVVRRNLDAMLGRLAARPNTRVLLAGMIAPPNMGGGYGEAFNRIYPELAQKYGVALYPFFLDGVAAVSDLNQDDAMHPNARGVAVIVERILPAVDRELQALGAAPRAG